MSCALQLPLLLGGSVILFPDRATPDRIFDLAGRYRPSIFYSVPTFYAAVLAGAVQRDALSSIRLCVSAGEMLPPAIYYEWRAKTGKEIVEHLGSTETLFACFSNSPGKVRPGSSGRPIPGVQARLVDDDLEDVPAGQPGMLLVKANSVAAGYWTSRCKPSARSWASGCALVTCTTAMRPVSIGIAAVPVTYSK